MTELYLRFEDANGNAIRSAVTGERFIVGRHSEADLCIPDARLSRQHIRIERIGNDFIATDLGSSNGSRLNGAALTSSARLRNGDSLDLGGVEVMVEFEVRELRPLLEPTEPESPVSEPESIMLVPEGPMAEVPATVSAGGPSSMILMLMIPIFGLMLLFFTGIVVYILVSEPTTTVAKKQDDDDDLYGDSDVSNKKSKPGKNSDAGNSGSGLTISTTGSNSSGGSSSNVSSTGGNSAPPAKLGENAKIEVNGAAFLRRIAQNDPRAFLTAEQAERVGARVRQLSGSSGVAENLKNAQKNSAALRSLAASKNLKPQFLAVAAIAKLGNSRGDVLQTAQGMAEVLDKLSTQLGSELADDSLLVIAAYGQGSAGDFMKMRNMLQDLSNKFPESSRAIRTIWFLQKNGKITQTEFDSALSFLAIGTIAQNPKDFGINAEALSI